MIKRFILTLLFVALSCVTASGIGFVGPGGGSACSAETEYIWFSAAGSAAVDMTTIVNACPFWNGWGAGGNAARGNNILITGNSCTGNLTPEQGDSYTFGPVPAGNWNVVEWGYMERYNNTVWRTDGATANVELIEIAPVDDTTHLKTVISTLTCHGPLETTGSPTPYGQYCVSPTLSIPLTGKAIVIRFASFSGPITNVRYGIQVYVKLQRS